MKTGPGAFPQRILSIFVFLLLTAVIVWMLRSRWVEVGAVSVEVSVLTTLLYLLPALLLMLLNWGLEALKFRVLVRNPEAGSFSRLWKAVLAGIAFSMLMPNRMGEVLGRVSCLRKDHRAAGVGASVTGSAFQLWWTLLIGGIVFLMVGGPAWGSELLALDFAWVWPLIGLVLVVALLSRFLGGVPRFLLAIGQHVRDTLDSRTATFGLGLALLRYGTYVLQFVLLLRFAGASQPIFNLMSFAAMVYFLQSILPLPPALGWLGRLQLAVLVGSVWHIGFAEAVVASLALWMINLVLPGLAGAWFWFRTFRLKSTNYAPIPQIS